MQMFVLNDVDYTQHILVPSYNVQRKPVTKEWEDATYTKHKDLLRWRLEGSFTIYFDDVGELGSFLDNLTNMRGVDNYIEADLYDNDTRTLKHSFYSIDVSLVNDKPYYGRKKHDGYSVSIEEK